MPKAVQEINKIDFVCRSPNRRKRRRHYVNEADVRVVLSRLPHECWHRLRRVHFSDDSLNHRLGYTTIRGRREINLCALPDRVSLTQAQGVAAAEEFGAIEGSQWPTLAVRRFQLYDTFLHEIGHLQVIHPKAANPKRKFADESKAEEFAQSWRRKMWSRYFDHPDPVHNAPTKEEIGALKAGWVDSHLTYKQGYKLEQGGKFDHAREEYHRAVMLYPNHTLALERLGILMYEHHEGDIDFLNMAESFLAKALSYDPLLPDANLYMEKIFAIRASD